MPNWLVKQLMKAFRIKDRRQIQFLNECWFQFQRKDRSHIDPSESVHY
jgi:hypothetical protein